MSDKDSEAGPLGALLCIALALAVLLIM